MALLAGSTALIPPVAMEVGVNSVASKVTDDALLNPEPANVSVVSPEPTETLVGLTLLIEGEGYESEIWTELLFEESAWLFAVIVIKLPFDGIGSGAL